jgi:hypothetical protein
MADQQMLLNSRLTYDRVFLIWVFGEEKQLEYYFIYQSI